ncbi:MAG: hypothetical protein V7719_17035 [Psychroserpens sp.]|uniref:hypothetical protein n=1 Tax=Psychroserpens sp. TaxID=2020870 RepID=UPI003002DF8E
MTCTLVMLWSFAAQKKGQIVNKITIEVQKKIGIIDRNTNGTTSGSIDFAPITAQ